MHFGFFYSHHHHQVQCMQHKKRGLFSSIWKKIDRFFNAVIGVVSRSLGSATPCDEENVAARVATFLGHSGKVGSFYAIFGHLSIISMSSYGFEHLLFWAHFSSLIISKRWWMLTSQCSCMLQKLLHILSVCDVNALYRIFKLKIPQIKIDESLRTHLKKAPSS